MGSKFFIGFSIIILGLFILYMFSNSDKQVKQIQELEMVQKTMKESESIEFIAIMENNMARVEQEDSDSLTTTDDIPDYTNMFHNLYTVNNIPTERKEEKKIAYLTFDDGPSKNTFEILKILGEKEVPATFFVVGSAINEKNEAALRQMIDQGHTIGIHTYSHMCNEIYCSIERYLNDFNKVYEQIYDITGKRVNIYRFPWGSNNSYSKEIKDTLIDEMARRGFTYYDWNVSADDSIGKPTAYSIQHNISKGLKNNDYPVILMHDSVINDLTVETLPQIIDMLIDKGYEFDTLDQREPYQFPW